MSRPLSTWEATRLVTARELKVKIRDKTFLFSTVFLLLFAAASTVLPAIFGGGASTVAVPPGVSTEKLTESGLELRQVADVAEAERLVQAGEVDAAVVPGDTVVAMEEAPDDVLSAVASMPEIRLLDPDAVSPFLAYLVPFVFSLVFFFTSLMFGLQIAQSVTEEKQTRIVEILVASVPPRVLLAGKVLANGLLAMGQIALIAAIALVGMRFSDENSLLLRLLAPAIGWFIPFFLVGFVLLAGMWAVTGALVSRQEDINGVSTPVQMAVMLPFFAVTFLRDNDTAMTVLSYIPFSAPVAMPIRLFTGDAAGWEPVVSLIVLVLSVAVALVLAARLYEGSLLRTNGKTTLGAAWRSREVLPG